MLTLCFYCHLFIRFFHFVFSVIAIVGSLEMWLFRSFSSCVLVLYMCSSGTLDMSLVGDIKIESKNVIMVFKPY